jgi:hypothetical protein
MLDSFFTKDPSGREILERSIRELTEIDRIPALIIVAAFTGLERTEAAIINTWGNASEIIADINRYMLDNLPNPEKEGVR